MWGPGPDVVDVRFEKLDAGQSRRLAMEPDPNVASPNVRGYDTFTVTIRRGEVQALMDDILEAIDGRRREGHFIEGLVLGDEHYVRLEAAARYASEWSRALTFYDRDDRIEVTDWLPVDDLIVVPGEMIEPVIDNQFRISEYHDRQGQGQDQEQEGE